MSDARFEDIFRQIEKAFSAVAGSKEAESTDSLIMRVQADKLIEALTVLRDKFGIRHLSTITGVDVGQQVELNYHFWYGNRIITIKTDVPKNDSKISTSISVIPGAILYEMEVRDMFGVNFLGHPWMDRRLLLPESYPNDMPPPLLKETSPEKIRRSLGLEK